MAEKQPLENWELLDAMTERLKALDEAKATIEKQNYEITHLTECLDNQKLLVVDYEELLTKLRQHLFYRNKMDLVEMIDQFRKEKGNG